eukprot:TRINITY_DN8013_c0_g8_i1.p1 TRINITY_DN8013_c0_g8~~TRINITY_DN8013_c0_g8_i1.p1  ORF type:complete len:197 (-),score=36.72 TRINITY_DN8013_c0_g8_i1:122-712(-)
MKQATKAIIRNRILPLRLLQDKTFELSKNIPQMIKSINEIIGVKETPKTLGGYYPIKGELNILPILRHFYDDAWTIGLPQTGAKNTPLNFVCWQNLSLSELTKGKFSIPTPSGSLVYPNVLLVPLVGFTDSCGRLGYGGGYYDKTLRLLRQLKVLDVAIGIAYEMQRCEFIPFEDNDEPLDAIVTENRVYQKLYSI